MSSAPVVVFDSVWKKFRRGERHDSLRDLVPAAVRSLFGKQASAALEAHEFWAVKDVSFEVRQGEALGIIGRNGAGKSTTLKLLTRILKPNQGHCHVTGRVGALIEVAAGFHPDLTGRENVFLQGSIMGMRRDEIARRFDEIVAFSGVEAFIDTPLKRYSSGMNARLGFAIAAHLEPHVLIIDEVLAVGDSLFQARCLQRILKLKREGVALVFVSHNLPAVEALCDSTVWLNQGEVQYQGHPRSAINAYLAALYESQEQARTPHADARTATDRVSILHVELVDETGTPVSTIRSGSTATVQATIHAGHDAEMIVGIGLHSADGACVFGENNTVVAPPITAAAGDSIDIRMKLDQIAVPEGQYYFNVSLQSPMTQQEYDKRERQAVFTVTFAQESNRIGSIGLRSAWTIDSRRAADPALLMPALRGGR